MSITGMHITGSYQHRGGDTWELVAELPSDPVTHKRNRRSKRIHVSSEKEAKRELRKYLTEIERGECLVSDNITVSEWMDKWINVCQEPVNSPTTVFRYRALKRQYIDGTSIGKTPIQKLLPFAVQTWVNSLRTSPHTGKPLSAKTISHAYRLLSQAMQAAVEGGILLKSPCTNIKLPKGEKKEAVVYDEEQMKLLVATAKGTEMELVIDMELCFGLRRGELLGLQWQDIDWKKAQLHVIRTRVVADGKVIVKPPKTPKSIRTLDIPDMLLQKLKAYKNECIANQLGRGKGFKEDNYIIVHPDGKPIYPEYLTQLLTKLQKRAGLPHCRFHDLRHLCASIMVKQGVNVKVAQQILGHKDIHTTLNIYAHVMPSALKEASDTVADFLYNDLAV